LQDEFDADVHLSSLQLRRDGTASANLREMALIYRLEDLKRALLLSGIVGSWLVTFNQGSAILEHLFTNVLYLRIFLDYATPFTVSSVTGILRNWSDEKKLRRAMKKVEGT
jgi:hypothetical protein